MKKEARYYITAGGGAVQCLLCPHNCRISDGNSGICGVRRNDGGKLYSHIYGELTAMAMDPIEKKPLYHFYPGSDILSIGTKGCNFKCSYCQNWNISQDINAGSRYSPPEGVVDEALSGGSVGIAYTYSEPMIWFEYVMDCAALARDRGLKNVLVTNGYVNRDPLEELLVYTDAMNIDLKNFREESHKKFQKGKLSDVLATIERAHGRCHLELTTLIVTGINDSMKEMGEIIGWIASLDRSIPWHVSRYYPGYRYDEPATDIDFIVRVCDAAKEKLEHVYCGNISGSYGRSDTACPSCGAVVIGRSGYNVKITGLRDGKCVKCGRDIGIPQ